MKKLITLLVWLVGSVAMAQTINGTSPSIQSIDGSNVTGAKVLTFPQVQSTVVATATPVATQATNWFSMNGNGAALVEFSGNTYAGWYRIDVSNNPTPVSTPGTNYYTVIQDYSTYNSGGQGAQTKNWSYMVREGWRYMRIVAQPEPGNTGTLNTQIRLFGNPTTGDASRAYFSGVPWKSVDNIVPLTTMAAVTATNYFDYKLPQSAHGLNLYTNGTVLGGAMTITSTVYVKDPVSGQLQAIAANPASHATAFTTLTINPGYAGPYPVATPPAGQTFYSIPIGQDVVVGNAFSGAGSMTYSQSVVPIQ